MIEKQVADSLRNAIRELRQEQAKVQEEIKRAEAIQRLIGTTGSARGRPAQAKRRGRPPKRVSPASKPAVAAVPAAPAAQPAKVKPAKAPAPKAAKRGKAAKAAKAAKATKAAKVSKAAKRGKATGRKKPQWSPAMREAARKRMQRYWAGRKKKAKKA